MSNPDMSISGIASIWPSPAPTVVTHATPSATSIWKAKAVKRSVATKLRVMGRLRVAKLRGLSIRYLMLQINPVRQVAGGDRGSPDGSPSGHGQLELPNCTNDANDTNTALPLTIASPYSCYSRHSGHSAVRLSVARYSVAR